MEYKNLKICYIGGGSKSWARVFMSDLAVTENLGGEVALYDIDIEAAQRNAKISQFINQNPNTKSIFKYRVYEALEEALQGADFVVISILPGTFKEMASDVHTPEQYGIYQSVGDTVGPGGILRAMRTVPIYEGFAQKIKEICPNAWVLNFTNPMSICTKTLYDVFPQIKAFGCCHEVFHTQDFLTSVLKEMKGIDVNRKQIYTDASGVNHFTWITEAKYQHIDLLALLPEFIKKYGQDGYIYGMGSIPYDFDKDPFSCGNRVKMDLYQKHGVLAAAGDRHLVEFLPNHWYLENKEKIHQWKFGLTPVSYREKEQKEKIDQTIQMANGIVPFKVEKSSEEAVDLIKAILGFGSMISNVNMPNKGQMSQLPLGSIVETNCIFSHDQVKPVVSKPLPNSVLNLVYRNCLNIDLTYEGIKERNLNKILLAFINQPLCSDLSFEQAKELFKEMCYKTRLYLDEFYDLDQFFK